LQTGSHQMNRIDFVSMINDPERVNSQNVEEIKELVDFFPYFQSAHLLLLKVLHNSSDLKFSGQLLLSSAHIANREVLYYLLNPSPDAIAPDPIKSSTEEIINPEAEKSAPGKTREVLIEEIEKRLSEIKSKDQTITDSFKSVITVENQQSPLNEEAVFELEVEGPFINEDLPVTGNEITDDSKTDLLNFEYNNISKLITNDYESSEQKTDSENSRVENSISEKVVSQSELIDKFILANPRIEPGKDKSEVAFQDISKSGNDEKGSFITETLARIYIEQEYYSRAIDIYEKLSLKFPEKSSYFATQIGKIIEIIKQK
jgi:hypothetical protein